MTNSKRPLRRLSSSAMEMEMGYWIKLRLKLAYVKSFLLSQTNRFKFLPLALSSMD
jgi:hypothetical protein